MAGAFLTTGLALVLAVAVAVAGMGTGVVVTFGGVVGIGSLSANSSSLPSRVSLTTSCSAILTNLGLFSLRIFLATS